MSRRNRHRNQPQDAGQPRESAAQATRRFMNNMPLPSGVTFIPDIRVCPADPPPPTPPDGEDAASEPRRESRANAVKKALRSRILFPLSVLEKINALADDISRQLRLSTLLERWLAVEFARSTVQCDDANDQLLLDKLRVAERVVTAFDDDNAERCDRLFARLHDEPHRIQRALSRDKQGTLLLIDKWKLFGDAIDSRLGIEEALRQTAFDLLGIENVYRHGAGRVPAATDVVGLRLLVTREIERHNQNLTRTLNARSETEKEMAHMGLARFRDGITRSLRGDRNRAQRRVSWALETIQSLKNGTDPSTIIDPLTGKPIAVGPPLVAVPDPVRPAAARQSQSQPQASPPPSAQAAPAPASSPLPPLPEGCSEEGKEMWWVAAGSVLGATATPARNESGPPPPAA